MKWSVSPEKKLIFSQIRSKNQIINKVFIEQSSKYILLDFTADIEHKPIDPLIDFF